MKTKLVMAIGVLCVSSSALGMMRFAQLRLASNASFSSVLLQEWRDCYNLAPGAAQQGVESLASNWKDLSPSQRMEAFGKTGIAFKRDELRRRLIERIMTERRLPEKLVAQTFDLWAVHVAVQDATEDLNCKRVLNSPIGHLERMLIVD